MHDRLNASREFNFEGRNRLICSFQSERVLGKMAASESVSIQEKRPHLSLSLSLSPPPSLSLHPNLSLSLIDVENTIVLKIDKLFGSPKDMYVCSYIPPYDSNYWKNSQYGYGIELLEQCILDMYDSLTISMFYCAVT